MKYLNKFQKFFMIKDESLFDLPLLSMSMIYANNYLQL